MRKLALSSASSRTWFGIIGVGILLVAIVGCGVHYASKQQQEITVDKMWTKYHKSSGQDATEKYLVSDTDGSVYCIQDDLFFFKFDASDRWARLDVGHTYLVTTVGWRITYGSQYPNIIEIEEV